MLRRDVCQRSCRVDSANNKQPITIPSKGAHIRKNKTPLKRGQRSSALKADPRQQAASNCATGDVGMVCCRKCRHEFESPSQFQEHSCAEESELYQCHTCKLLFNHRKRFQEHMKQHRQNECKMCGQQFLRRKALLVHSRSMHGLTQLEKHYSCSHCERKFIKRPSLIAHLKTHADSNKVVCIKCGAMCENEEEHRKHLDGHLSEVKFECERCGATFRRRQQYDQHMAGHNKHDCPLCRINFSTKKQLENHQKKAHDISKVPVKNHECSICGKKFYRPATLKTHLKTHTNSENPVHCQECKKYFRTAASLAKHLKSTSHSKNEQRHSASYLCAICGNQFTHTQGLNRHMLLVHGDKEEQVLSCDSCGYKTRSKTNLKRHMEIHSEKRYICEMCGTAFHAHATLKQHHLYVHSDKRDFACDKCNKTFKMLSALQRHQRVHNDARPFACHCGQKYKRKSHLKRHMAAVHEVAYENKSEESEEEETVQPSALDLPEQSSIPCAGNELLLLNDCHQSTEPYINNPAECHQQNVGEISYLNSDMMQIPDDVMPIYQQALEQSIMGLEHLANMGDGGHAQTDISNSLICPMSVLDNMELQPNYCLQSDSLQMSEMMLKHVESFRNDEALPLDPIDCSQVNISSNHCNFESYLCGFREATHCDNYQQFNF